jgi:hypothetical protein
MAKKKKDLSLMAGYKEEESPIDNVKKLDELTLAKLLRYDAETRAANLEIQLLQKELTDYIVKVDPSGTIGKTHLAISNIVARRCEMKARYDMHLKAAGLKLDIDLTKCSFDDETGIIQCLPESE